MSESEPLNAQQIFERLLDASPEQRPAMLKDLCAGDEIRGPAIVREALSTTYITQNQIARVGRFGEIGIERIR